MPWDPCPAFSRTFGLWRTPAGVGSSVCPGGGRILKSLSLFRSYFLEHTLDFATAYAEFDPSSGASVLRIRRVGHQFRYLNQWPVPKSELPSAQNPVRLQTPHPPSHRSICRGDSPTRPRSDQDRGKIQASSIRFRALTTDKYLRHSRSQTSPSRRSGCWKDQIHQLSTLCRPSSRSLRGDGATPARQTTTMAEPYSADVSDGDSRQTLCAAVILGDALYQSDDRSLQEAALILRQRPSFTVGLSRLCPTFV